MSLAVYCEECASLVGHTDCEITATSMHLCEECNVAANGWSLTLMTAQEATR
jgi:spore coat polysaccharide biosynthesis predicted glycosyltransferase SpsG